MPASKQATRRQIAKIRAEMHSSPWAIDARALNELGSAIETGDMEAVSATLSIGVDPELIGGVKNGIKIIPVTGVLRDEVDYMVRWGGASSYQQIEQAFSEAIANQQVKGVLFYFDSPGGSAIGCKRIADMIYKARGAKPIRAFVQGMCGSAAFYMACACDRIDSTGDSLVASVGSIYAHLEYSGAYKEFGIAARVFTNTDSPKKGHGNSYEPLSDEAAKTLQDFVDSYGRPFIEDVARYRGITPEDVMSTYGQGSAIRADVAVKSKIIDGIVDSFAECLNAMAPQSASQGVQQIVTSVEVSNSVIEDKKMNERIKAQLFALGLIDSLDAPESECQAALRAFFAGRGQQAPESADARLTALQAKPKAETDTASDEEEAEEEADEGASSKARNRKPQNVQEAHNREQAEARLADLRASAELINETAGYAAISADMVLDAFEKKLDATSAVKLWKEELANKEKPINSVRITGEGADRYAQDIVDALVYRASDNPRMELSDNAARLVNRPLWAVAGECLQLSGQNPDMYGSRELLAEQAMQMGAASQRHTFFSANEDRRYVQSSSTPTARPGDFPNILSALANRFLDTIQLDDDYSYPAISAVLPGGLNDFKPAMMINKGIVEEMDELQDAEQFKDLGLAEEVLSYIFLRRFGNKWGWTPVLVANDDMNAFAEGMLGLAEAWQVTQNRLVLDRLTANEALLDGSSLFADRANTGTATNNNDRTSGAAPSDAEWGAMETLYADIGGINTGRRVRGSLNVALVPTGAVAQEARRTFLPLNAMGLEGKVANTTANVGLYRGEVQVVPESELRASSATRWFGLRNPTRLNTATIVRAYFNGFGTAGRRERWYDPTTKTTYVSLEGRIATAVKNWRYAIRNAGA